MKNNNGLKSQISRRITLLAAAALIILSVIAGSISIANRRTLNEEFTSAELSECASVMDSWIENKITFIDFMQNEIITGKYYQNKRVCGSFLANCITRDEDVFECYVGLEDSTCVFGGGWAPTPEEFDPTTRTWYKDAKASDTAVVTAPYADAQTGK